MKAERALVPREEPSSYYGRPIVKQPVWKPEIPFYFFFGGLAGASAGLAAGATFAGRPQLARRAWAGAFVGVAASPALLISDLGKPSRFLYMLRVVKVTSPMSIGAWLLAANGAATTVAAALNLRPGRRGGAPELGAALLGAPLATYTAALITNSAIPAWSEARRELPFVFAASAAASAAGAAMLTVPGEEAEPVRALGIGAVVLEEAASKVMLSRLGPELASSYQEGVAGRFEKAARALSFAGAAAFAAGRGRRGVSAAGGALLLAGALCKRWAVFKAGFHSAADPAQTVDLQRQRIARNGGSA